jgi:sugar phosphate isomerase/epimerase
VKAAIEIHMGTIAPSASAVRRLLEGFDPEAVGAILDPGNMIHEGYESWSLAAAILGPYLAHVHVKNALWRLEDRPAGGPWRWSPKAARLREGAADWREILRVLREADYDGFLTVEDLTDQPAREKLEDALAFLKELAS